MVHRIIRRLAAAMLVPLLLFSQKIDIRGIVTDSTTGERIPFANVILPGMSRGAGTNIQGFYLIANAPAGKYQITASSI